MSEAEASGFTLDPQLAADTVLVADWALSRVLLMDDTRFPWLILVPRHAGLIELDDLRDDDQLTLLHEINRAMGLLRKFGRCDKLNLGALGNVVPQFHMHVVARRRDDAAWPRPVWGSGSAIRYDQTTRDALLQRLRNLQ